MSQYNNVIKNDFLKPGLKQLRDQQKQKKKKFRIFSKAHLSIAVIGQKQA